MSIAVRRNPERLTWADFISIPIVIDPNDGTEQIAFTAFDFNIPDEPPRTIDGHLALAETFEIIITPRARVKIGGPQSPELLAHQQFYYDVGFVVARVVARELMSLRAGDERELAAAAWNTAQLHFIFRAGLIQRRYDLDTRHGTVRYDQQLWTWRMSTCLADPSSSQIGGFWL
jgi:hypothetical protein